MFKGTGGRNGAYDLVSDYLERKALSEIGFQFDYDELSDFEVEYLTLIHHEFKRLQNEQDLKVARRGNKKGFR